MEIHNDCKMKNAWAKLNEQTKTTHVTFVKYMQSQSEINAVQASTLQKIMHRIYGNAEEGMLSDIRANKQSAESDIKRVEDALKRLWWAFGLIGIAMIGNMVKNLFF